MKRLILFLIVALSTFSLSLVLDQIFKPEVKSAPQIQELGPLTRIVVEAPSPPTPVAIPIAAPTPLLIFDFDWKHFNPDGLYFIKGDVKRELKEFDSFELLTGDGETSSGYIGFQSLVNDAYQSSSAVFGLVTEKRLFFVTQPTKDGFEYRFDGEFLRGGVLTDAGEKKAVLRGRLTKSKKGRMIIERVVSFRVEHVGC